MKTRQDVILTCFCDAGNDQWSFRGWNGTMDGATNRRSLRTVFYVCGGEKHFMKLLHLADLHLGKRVNEFDLIEDQRYLLQQILQIVEQEQPEVVLIAGDVYDKSQPSIDAVELMDEFLTALISLDRQVF